MIDNSSSSLNDPYLITKEFKSSNEFSQHIEKLATVTGSYIDSIVDYCAKKDIEVESVKKLLSPSLKEKIKAEADNKEAITLASNAKKAKIKLD